MSPRPTSRRSTGARPGRRPRRGAHRAVQRSPLRKFLLVCYAVAVGFGLVVGVGSSSPASAAAGDAVISGHGFGHGRGLSQWGSYGYATHYGWTYLQILQHYYSNATLGNIGYNPDLTVRLTALDNTVPQVTSQAPFTVGGYWLAGGTVAQVNRNADGTWTLTTSGSCNGSVVGTAAVASSWTAPVSDPGNDLTKMLTVCDTGRTYRGALSLAFDGTTSYVVNTVSMEDYLRGVVPRESPASWGSASNGLAALMAQAVAARSYAWAENRSSLFKTCDSTSCQVYGGAGLDGAPIEDSRSDSAVVSTAGQIEMLNGSVARTEFSSSSGGYTAGGTFPAVPDDGDLAASPYANWSTTVPGTTISNAFGVGALQSITVLARNGLGADGGRVTSVRVTGTQSSVTVSGSAFRSAVGLKSDWFSIVAIQQPVAPVVTTVNDASTGYIPDLSPSQMSALVSAGGTTTLFARGTDGGIWYRSGSGLPGYGGSYTAWQSIPGTRATSGPAVVTSDGNWLDIVVRGNDGAYWHNGGPLDANGRPSWFVGWTSLGGTFTTAPSIAAIASNRLAVAGRGGDGQVYLKIWDGSAWSGWGALGGQAYSAPALSADVANQRYLVSVMGMDSTVWQVGTSLTTPVTAGPWVGGAVSSTLTPGTSAGSWTRGQENGLSLGGGDHGGLLLTSDGVTRSTGGAFTSGIAIAPQWDGSYYLFGRGLDKSVWMARYVGGQFSAWLALGGVIA